MNRWQWRRMMVADGSMAFCCDDCLVSSMPVPCQLCVQLGAVHHFCWLITPFDFVCSSDDLAIGRLPMCFPTLRQRWACHGIVCQLHYHGGGGLRHRSSCNAELWPFATAPPGLKVGDAVTFRLTNGDGGQVVDVRGAGEMVETMGEFTDLRL